MKSKSKNKVNESDHEAVSTKPDQKQSKPQKQVKNPLQSKLKNKKLSIERTWSDVKGCRKAGGLGSYHLRGILKKNDSMKNCRGISTNLA